MTTFTILPRGPFSLRESAIFGFGQREKADDWDGVMRLAFCLDGYATAVGVSVTQDESGVHGRYVGEGDAEAIRGQVARVLSLSYDATGFVAVGERDPVVAKLLAAAPGLRPPLFYSPYEAAAWCVLSARRPAAQMREVRRRLSEEHGTAFELSGERLAAFPTPQALLGVSEFPGIPAVKLERLHVIARAALEGELESDRIREMEPEQAMAQLRTLPGIGPLYSSLIVLRAVGVRDVLPPDEPRVRALAQRLYGLPAEPGLAEFATLAEPWKPWRTWVCVLMRAATDRVL